MTQAMERRAGADAPVVNGPHRVRKPWPVEFYSTAVGKKWVMALSGLALMGFVFVHMVGNLKMFLGRERVRRLRRGPAGLRCTRSCPHGWMLWAVRIGLIVAFAFHIHAAYSLTRMNHRSRPVKYQSPRDYIAANFASRTMRWTGVIVGLYIVFHLMDLTWGWVNPDFVRGAAYDNLVASLEPVAGRPRLRLVATSPSASTSSTGRGRCSRASGSTAPATTAPVEASPPASPRSSPSPTSCSRSWCWPASSTDAHCDPAREARPTVALTLDAKIPDGPLADKWTNHKFDLKLVNPNNRRKFDVIVVGTGLAGAAAAATLGELGYNVKVFTYHDSPRRAHSIAAQGGINAAKNYRNDGDSIHRLFYDTIKGGDYRSREGNVYRLAEVSVDIIDQCAAQGVPFAREYGGLLDNRSFGGAQVSRTFYARGQTGQQLLLGAYQALARQIHLGTVTLYNRMEMLDVVTHEGRAVGITCRDLLNGEVSSHSAHAVMLATGGYGNVYFLSTNAKACNVTATWRAHKKGAGFANPCFTQIHPTCIPASDEFQSKLTLMSESLRNDGRIWVPEGVRRPPSGGRHPRVRARLLPRAQVPGVRQPRSPRRRVTQRQDRGRRGPRRRSAQERRVPRLRRRHRPVRRRHHP